MPLEVAQMVLSSSAPINSIEGFLRQLIWREYVRHVYEVTNGLGENPPFRMDKFYRKSPS